MSTAPSSPWTAAPPRSEPRPGASRSARQKPWKARANDTVCQPRAVAAHPPGLEPRRSPRGADSSLPGPGGAGQVHLPKHCAGNATRSRAFASLHRRRITLPNNVSQTALDRHVVGGSDMGCHATRPALAPLHRTATSHPACPGLRRTGRTGQARPVTRRPAVSTNFLQISHGSGWKSEVPGRPLPA